MADAMDRVQEVLEHQVAQATARGAQVSEFFCVDCDSAIPEARRRALCGVTRCVACQELAELKSRHYRSSL